MKKKTREKICLFETKWQMIVYFLVIAVSISYIFVGHTIAVTDYHRFSGDDQSIVVKAEVKEVIDHYTERYPISEYEYAEDETVVFLAEVKSGALKGEVIEAAQTLDYVTAVHLPIVEQGDRVLLYTIPGGMADHEWLLSDYERFDQIIILGIAFVLLVLLIGRWQGFNTLVSLILTCLSIFYVFIPAVLAGENIYLWAVITCVYVTFMTLFIVNGVNHKSIAAILGCLAGVLAAAILTVVLERTMMLTGLVDENAVLLYGLRQENPFDLRAIIFAAITIGSMGAIMDVSISIAAALAELKEKLPQISFRELWQSGMNISRDIMGTMANTLILAYIGSCLSGVLLMVAYNSSMLDLFNREMIVVECLQALVGSIGILLALPFTTLICAALFQRKKNEKVEKVDIA